MSITLTNMGLTEWDQPTDHFSYTELAANWNKVDVHDHTSGKGVQIPTGGIANLAVTLAKIADLAVGTTKIADLGVTTAKIADANVTTPKIADANVTTVKIADANVTLAKLATAVAQALIPVGTIMAWGGAAGSPPAGYLVCQGQAVSRATYSALFGVIGTTYGAGDGSTTFNLPDPQGRTLIGAGTGAGLTNRTHGATGGEENHLLTGAESGVKSHSHTASQGNHSHGFAGGATALNAGGGYSNMGTGGAGVGTTTQTDNPIGGPPAVTVDPVAAQNATNSHNNMQPWLATNYIIKT